MRASNVKCLFLVVFKSVIFSLHPPRVSQTEFYSFRLPILIAMPLSTVDLTLGINSYFKEYVSACMARIEAFNPEMYGYRWAQHLSPRMQLAPEGWRGYIEMRPVELMQ